MTHTVIAIIVAAVLFAVYGLVPHRACTGHCEGCTGASCPRRDQGEHHVV